MKKFRTLFIRTFVFGVEDSLVSTVGLLSGIAIAGVPRETIFLTGVVLVFVEAVSMAAGSFLSEYSAEEIERHRAVRPRTAEANGVVMFVSYFVSGFVPLVPYALFDVKRAFWFSIIFSLCVLGALGVMSARLARVRVWRDVVRMVVIGGVAISVGVFVGNVAARY